MNKDYENKLDVMICQLEAGGESVNIGQVNEILRVMADIAVTRPEVFAQFYSSWVRKAVGRMQDEMSSTISQCCRCGDLVGERDSMDCYCHCHPDHECEIEWDPQRVTRADGQEVARGKCRGCGASVSKVGKPGEMP